MPNKVQLVSNRVEIAKNYLLSQFKDKPNILALVDVLVTELQELENTIIELQNVRTISGARGWWLDRIGDDLDTPRNGYNDGDYKTILRIEMLKKTASASIEDIIRVLSLLSNDSELRVSNPNKYLIEAVGYMFDIKDVMVSSVADLFPLNSRKLIVQRDITPFKFSTAGQGFGSGSLNSILLYKDGIASDPRFVSLPTEQYIPPVVNSPTVNTTPYIYGTGEVGQTLMYVSGTFNGVLPMTVTKQWQANNIDISGATGSIYTVVSGDAGKTITVKTTATNADGSLVVYSNNITVSSVIPPVSLLTNDLGLSNFDSSRFQAYDGLLETANHSLVFDHTGEVIYTDAEGIVNTTAYLTTVGVHNGDNYGIRYSVLTGYVLTGLPENTTHTLSTALTLSQSVTSGTTSSEYGTYRFTIFKLDDPSITQTVDISMSVIIERDL